MLDKTKELERVAVTISAPNLETINFKLEGTAPYMQARFALKAMNIIREKHMAGSVAKKGKKREARDFKEDWEGAMHVSEEGWPGIPAGAFRAACISACRLVGFKMTLGKLSLFVEADGLDRVDGTPLIRIHGKVEPFDMSIMPVRNATGVIDLRCRPKWKKWSCELRVTYDRDQFTKEDVANLIARVGLQVGIGEGRPDSRDSCGLGYGLFKSVQK